MSKEMGLNRDMGRDGARDVGIEAVTSRWSQTKRDAWCKDHETLIDDFEEGVAQANEQNAGE